MMKLLGIALGAGVTSAVLFAVTTTATSPGLVLAYLAPLPVMIAGLGFTHGVGAAAALVGGGTVGLALGPMPALVFLLLLGLPAWYLAWVSLLGRPAVAAEAAVPATGPAIEWFPISGLAIRLAALAAAPVLVAGIAVVWRFGGYDAAVTTMAARLADLFGREPPRGDLTYADIVKIAPLAIAASSTLMLSFNLWLAGRTVAISDRLARPWPNLPDGLRLPRAVTGAFGVLLATSLAPGPFGVAAEVLAAALGMIFVFEGLALAHVLTRGLRARRAILAGLYLVVALNLPWTLYALAMLGCIDSLAPLRAGAGITIVKRPTRRS